MVLRAWRGNAWILGWNGFGMAVAGPAVGLLNS
jgi:hypothetical protein